MNTICHIPSFADVQSLVSPVRSGSASVARKSKRSFPKKNFFFGDKGRNIILARENIQHRPRPALIPRGQIDAQQPESGDNGFHNEVSIVPIDHAQSGSRDTSRGGQTDSRDQYKLPNYLLKVPEKISLVRNQDSDLGEILSNEKGTSLLPTNFPSLSKTGRPEYYENVANIISTVKFFAKSPFALMQRRLVQARVDFINRWYSCLDLQDLRDYLLAVQLDTGDFIAKPTPHLRALLPLVLLNLRAPTSVTQPSIRATVRLTQRSALQIVTSEWTDP